MTTSCTKKLSNPTSNTEFAELLSESLLDGNYDAIEEFTHPDTPKDIPPKVREMLRPFFENLRPKTVTFSFIELSKVPIDLPGTLEGKQLEYISLIDGVVHLKGVQPSELGENTLDFYIPFHRKDGSFYIAAVNYTQKD